MDRIGGPLVVGLLLGALLIPQPLLAQWEVEIGVKQTNGRWQDTLVAGDTCWVTVSITNPGPVAAYVIPLVVKSETNSAFAQLLEQSLVRYVGRMITPGNPFSTRPINTNGVNGTSPDSILFGAVEFGENYLPTGTGIVLEYPLLVQPFVGNVRIDTGLIPPSNKLSLTDPDAVEFFPTFNPNPVFPVILRVPNQGPTCTAPSDINSPFGVPLSARFTATDPEGNPLSFRQVSGPGTTTAAGVWTWTPACANVGVHQVCVTVSDPNHIDWDTCCITVVVTQAPPTLNCVDQSIHYADTLSYFVQASDDGCPQALRFFRVSGPGTINATTGEYRYIPTCGDVGSRSVQIGVTDGRDTLRCTFGVDVTNNPPLISCPPDFSSGIGDTVDFVIPANDPDGDPVTFSLLDFQKLSGPTSGGPNFAPSLSPTGRFFWPTTTDNDDDFGVWEVSLRVDEPCDSAFCTFEIEVTPNRPPVCMPPSNKSVLWSVGTASARFVFYDPDGDSISFRQISGPGTMDTTGLWSWSFGCEEVGTYEICAVVADSAFPNGDTCCFTLRIYQNPPDLVCSDTIIHTGTGPLTLDLTAIDDGCPGNDVRYKLISGPGQLDSVTGEYLFGLNSTIPACKDIGSYLITVAATDGDLSDTCMFTVTVYNQPPFFACLFEEPIRHTSDRTFVYDSELKDPDGDDIVDARIQSFVKLSGPPGGPNEPPQMGIDGIVTWETDSSNSADLGLWRMVLFARDTCDASRCTTYVEVFPNAPPECYAGDRTGQVGDTALGYVLAVDPDGDSLTFTQISGPGAITIAPNLARWTWLTECSDTGTYEICVTVSDAAFPDADTCCFMVTIFEEAPLISCSAQTLHYGGTLVYDIAFEDDACPEVATWSQISGPGTLDELTGQYTWTTGCADVGVHPVTVALFDGKRADTCTFDVVVTNTPPFVDCPSDLAPEKVGAAIDVTIPFGDVDGDPATIGLVTFQKLGGANTNPPNNPPTLDAGGNFQWITDVNNLNDVATWEVTVRARELCDSTQCSFRIEILPNEDPTCSSPSDTNATCAELLSLEFGASDPEDDEIMFDLIAGPGAVGPTTGVWSWTAPCDSGGLYEVCVTVSDFLHADADTCCLMLSMCAVSEPGDVNANGVANAEDIIIMVNFIFKSGEMPFGDYTADMNCNGVPNSEDIIGLVNYVFKSGPSPCDACTSPLFPGLGP